MKKLTILLLTGLFLTTSNITNAQGIISGPDIVEKQVSVCKMSEQIERNCIKQFCELKEDSYEKLAGLMTHEQVDEVCKQLTNDSTPTITPSQNNTNLSPIPSSDMPTSDIGPRHSEVGYQEKPQTPFRIIVQLFSNFFQKILKR